MTKKIALAFVSGALGLLAFFGCKKNKEDNNSITKEHLAGTYKLSSFKYATSGITFDYMLIADTCLRDDLYRLNLDMSMNHIDAGKTCGAAAGYSSTWILDGKKITLVIPDMTDTIRGNVTKYDGRELDIVQDSVANGQPLTISAVLVKQ